MNRPYFFLTAMLLAPLCAGLWADVRKENKHWKATYQDFGKTVKKLDEQVQREFFPEFLLIQQNNFVAVVQIDAFASKVLLEASPALLEYREGLARCAQRKQNEYRTTGPASYEEFAWFLDDYVELLDRTLGPKEDSSPKNGVKKQWVATDRELYAYSQLALAYLKKQASRMQSDEKSLALVKGAQSAVSDIARRVLRLDLARSFSADKLLAEGFSSLPVFRDLAAQHKEPLSEKGLRPIQTLKGHANAEPLCTLKP